MRATRRRDRFSSGGAETAPALDRQALRVLLERDIHPMRLKIEAPFVDEILSELSPALDGPRDPLGAACARLSAVILGRFDRIAELKRINDTSADRVARAPDATAQRLAILDFARALGADARQLKGDARAFRRWFGLDAVAERYRRGVAMAERQATFELGRLGVLAAETLRHSANDTLADAWRRSGIEAAAESTLQHQGDARIRTAGFACLSAALSAAAPEERERLVGDTLLRRIYGTAYRRGPETGAQIEALNLVWLISPERLHEALRRRLADPPAGDDFWVRRHAVDLLCAAAADIPDLPAVLAFVRADPSPSVRQALAERLSKLTDEVLPSSLPALARDDPAPEVRAAALLELPALAPRLPIEDLATLWTRVVREEASPFVLRVALRIADDMLDALEIAGAEAWAAAVIPAIERLHREAAELSVRRWAAQARERIWCRRDPSAAELAAYLRSATAGRKEGRTARLARIRKTAREDPERVARVLAVIAQDNFGFDFSPGGPGRAPKVRRGDRFVFRLWRALHEVRHASPDKRQAFSHTVGRVFPALWHAPSTIMAELAQTKVPGEPLFIGDEAGWRPYLPLPDHVLSAIDTGKTVRLVTSEGVTEMTPPRGLFRRLRSRVRLSARFEAIAALRNWTERRGHAPSAYVEALEELGLRLELRPHAGGGSIDPAVSRFFPAIPPMFLPPEVWRQIDGYFLSVYSNTLKHLAIFIAAVLAWFVGRHLWVNARMQQTRAALPLVLGGWGTRGKSGTERIKAALVNALGYSLVSKTTGNEAMFLYGFPFGPVKEMFLFRPYDKATIWEQENIARLATRLNGEVFLWECMGLTPSYVKVLQRHWMRDDISTITNTYPDHEDLQGPAGRNIPEVMTNFIPRRGRLITSEEQMRPILADSASSLGTSLAGVGWLEAGLLPADALARFPYEEHPFNIALVLRLADEIGAGRDFALKEMADRVVPDLGVLKAYPVATIRHRRIEFVMGMSANERFGAMGNWSRMGLDAQDPYAEPGVQITAVVNNRADRIPRSRVFADLLVNDVSLDRIVLIGSNLEGMRGYIDEELEARLKDLSLWPGGEDGVEGPAARLEAAAQRLRIPYRDAHVAAHLRRMLECLAPELDIEAALARHDDPAALGAMLSGAGVPEAEAVAAHVSEMRNTVAEYAEIEVKLAGTPDRGEVDRFVRARYAAWFRRKIVVLGDLYASGDQVIDVVADATPPGYLNRAMGVQNIKGTGLDFVYRWQAWEVVHRACEMAESPEPLVASDGLHTLLSFQEFGIASEHRVRATLARLRARSGEATRGQLDLVEAALEEQMEEVRRGMNVTRSTGLLPRVIASLEAVLDAGDAVRRRKAADRIYRDMIDERISHERAARELKRLNSRQKGGWLNEDLASYAAKFAKSA